MEIIFPLLFGSTAIIPYALGTSSISAISSGVRTLGKSCLLARTANLAVGASFLTKPRKNLDLSIFFKVESVIKITASEPITNFGHKNENCSCPAKSHK